MWRRDYDTAMEMQKKPYLTPNGSHFGSREICVIAKLIQTSAFRNTINEY